MQVAAAEFLRGDDLAGGGLHQRRPAEEDGALVADDDGLVAHRGHVGAARGARAEDRGDLRDALGAHGGLVVEDAAEVLAVGEHLVLPRQERPAGVDQVQARQLVLQRDLLGPQMLLHRHRVVGAALDGGVVGDDHALAAGHPSDAGDHPGTGALVVVHAVRGQRRDLEECAAGIEQGVDALAGQQLPAGDVPFPGFLAAAESGGRELVAQLGDQLDVLLAVGPRSGCRGGLSQYSPRLGVGA